MPEPEIRPPPAGRRRRPFSLRNRGILAATLVLFAALALVGLALYEANYRVAVSSLQARMESYLYLVLAAMDVDASGRLSLAEEDLADPRLNQPGSGMYLQVEGRDQAWQSPSLLGVDLPELSQIEAGQSRFAEPGDSQGFFLYQYGIGWQLEDGSIEPFAVSVLVDAAEIRGQTRAFRQGLWRYLGAAAVILLLAQLAILYLVFRPLNRVSGDVARVESGLAERLEGEYPLELEPLARNVNRLLDTEQANQARIRNALDSLAHSLKTPLAVIQAGLPLHGGSAADSMQNAVHEMQRLIATRLERAGSSARRTLAEPAPVLPQLQRIIASLDKVYSHRLITAEVTMDSELNFYGEERDLLELMGNLLDNAYKYGKGRVVIGGGEVDGDSSRPGLWLRVEDDGPGIDPGHRERLLQRGTRGDERVEGHGLGLAIVLELVTAYGGDIQIDRSDLGGARIDIRIPGT
ncbi:MAG: two-component sensor histidine kinase [Gammaproteobacteria bacterium]|nr:two-component sensor histidine kinase [Gammaproteobacteria bacterium]